MAVGKTIARNTIFNAMGRVVEAMVGLVLTWYVVQRIGTEGWGVWSLVAIFTGYAALLDFGVGSGFVKYIAEHAARKNTRALSQVVSTGFYFYVLFGIVVLAIGWPLLDWGYERIAVQIARNGTEAAAHGDDLNFLFHGALVLFALNNCVAPFACVPTGLQRMGLTNIASVCSTLLKIPVTVMLLEAGYGVRGLLYAALAATLFFGAASVIMAFYLLPGLRVWPTYWRGETFATLFSFGWRAQIAKLSNLINFQTDRVVVATVSGFGNMGLVGLYGLGEMLAAKKRQIPALLVSALIPAASDLDARDSQDKLRTLCIVSTKYMSAVAVPLSLFFACSADVLLLAWLGPREGLEIAAWVLRILSVGYLFNVLPGPGVSVVLGKGRADIPMFAGLLSMSSNISLTIMLYYLIGFYGIAIATALSMAISTIWFFRRLQRLVEVSLSDLLVNSLRWPFLAAIPGAVVCVGVNFWVSAAQDQWAALGVFAVLTPIFCLFYGLCLRHSPFLDEFDVRFLGDTLRLRKIPGFQWFTARVVHA